MKRVSSQPSLGIEIAHFFGEVMGETAFLTTVVGAALTAADVCVNIGEQVLTSDAHDFLDSTGVLAASVTAGGIGGLVGSACLLWATDRLRAPKD